MRFVQSPQAFVHYKLAMQTRAPEDLLVPTVELEADRFDDDAGLKSTPVQINLENVFIVAGLVKKFDGQEHIKGMRNATDQAILAANGAEEASRVLELDKARREVSELLKRQVDKWLDIRRLLVE